MSFGLRSGTKKTSVVFANFKGNPDRPITIIDTKGIVDPNLSDTERIGRNEEIQRDILRKLNEIDGIHLFVICWNGSNPRLTASLVEMLIILQDMFGHRMEGETSIVDIQEFWRRCVICYSRVSWDESSIRLRKRQMRNSQVQDMRDAISSYFGIDSSGIECVYIDALYDAKDEFQLLKFTEETEKLYSYLLDRDPMMISTLLNCSRNSSRFIGSRHSSISLNGNYEIVPIEQDIEEQIDEKGIP